MICRKTIIYFFSLLILSQGIYGQIDSSQLIKYTPDFKFKDGIFLNFDQVKRNQPLSKSMIVTDVAYDDPYFFDRVMQSKKVYFYDTFGAKQELTPKKAWGYARNGVLYINLNDGFYRITIVGSICHFVANLTTYDNSYYPYTYNGYYSSYPYGRPSNRTTTEMRQYLLDFSTGKIMDYDETSIEVLLMKDPVLHDEYMELKKKKKKQLKFMYIRKFNEKNPIYFPKPGHPDD